MKRNNLLEKLRTTSEYDVLIIGGGATGLGCAVDAASRGYSTLLLEQVDFAGATSSRSTKLIHGGLRYLQQGNFGLVFEALHERGLLCQNAPHLIKHRPFLVPCYKWWEGPFYGIGLKIYDLLAGRLGIETSKSISRQETLETLPTIDPDGLKGGTIYYDGQFDDARLAVTLALTATDLGATVINYITVTGFIKKEGQIIGVNWKDALSGETGRVFAKTVVNATGIFSDQTAQLDDPKASKHLAPSQGVHLVLPASFLPGDTALLIPKTEDGRVIFIVPWHDRLVVGTTDVPKDHVELEPTPSDEEIDFILEEAGKYLSIAPQRSDILSVFTGLRPLVKESGEGETKKIARNHKIYTSPSGLITVAGGKWTTYRKMAMDVIDTLVHAKKLPPTESATEHLKLHGYMENVDPAEFKSAYGSDLKKLREIIEESPLFAESFSEELPYFFAEVVFAARYEMAQRVEDVLSRRTRTLLLDAKQAIHLAPKVAEILAKELGKDDSWIREEIASFTRTAQNYLP